MAFSINEFKAGMKYGGARPHLFEVQIALPPALIAVSQALFSRDIPVKAVATAVPASQVDPIPAAYQGRVVNFSGNRTYSPWTVEVYNDEDFNVYDGFVGWLSALNDPLDNVRNSGFNSRPSLYKSQCSIIQRGQDQSIIKSWTVQGIFPVLVSEIQLSWEAMNQIERFQVTFAVDNVLPSITTRA